MTALSVPWTPAKKHDAMYHLWIGCLMAAQKKEVEMHSPVSHGCWISFETIKHTVLCEDMRPH